MALVILIDVFWFLVQSLRASVGGFRVFIRGRVGFCCMVRIGTSVVAHSCGADSRMLFPCSDIL